MARTSIAAQSFPLSSGQSYYPQIPLVSGSADIVWTTGDPADGHVTPIIDGKTVVMAYNSDTSAHTITISSVTDSLNRSGDISGYSIAGGQTSFFGPFKLNGWNQATPPGLWIDVNNAAIKLAVLTTPC